ncbi:MAG: thiamine pyrophosphate-binding protein, partial [Clostridia bacterium]
MNGAEIVVKTLYKHGVRTVFGYPGGSILPVYDCLNGSKIRHILASHEQFACHAADGYARASGKTGVVMATSGPGATNLVTGIANAYMDSVPLIAITGNVPLDLLGHDAFQEIDIAGVTMPITKHNFIVKSVEDLAPTLCRAFQIAQSGRKGPVLIDIPTDIFYKSISKFILAPLPLKHIEISYSELETAAELINKSKFPFICVGGGVISSESSEKISLLADKCGAAVATTNMGKGGFPCSSSQYTGLVGMQINSDTIRALKNCDVFIAAGVRFSERLMKNVSLFAPKAKILHFDVDAAEIGKNAEIYRRVWGDIGEALDLLNPKIEQKQP